MRAMNLNKRTLAAGLVFLALMAFGAWLAFSPQESEPPALVPARFLVGLRSRG